MKHPHGPPSDRGPDRLPTLFEDDHLVVVVKPAGLPTANAPAGAPSVYAVLRDRRGGDAFIGVVSRLDAAVSGVLVVAKTSTAAAHLAAQFRDRTVAKTYFAVVEGRFPGPVDVWQQWHDELVRGHDERRSTLRGARSPARGQAPSDDPEASESFARLATTRARVVHRAGEVSLAELHPSTGRRHQLRVQLATRGCPIVGDRLYGARLPFPEGIALHARSIAFDHPAGTGRSEFIAPWPADWKARFSAVLGSRIERA